MSLFLVEHVSTMTTVVVCIKHINASNTMDGCVCASGAHVIAVTNVHGVYVSLVQHDSALTTVDGGVCVPGATC